MDCSTPGSSVLCLPEFAQIHAHLSCSAIQPSHPLSPPSPSALNLSQHQSFPVSQLFASGGQIIGASALASVHPSEYSGLISFRINRFHLHALQGTLKSLLQHHSSKASVLWHSAFFMDQLSHLYVTTGKTIALTRQTFVVRVMSLLFNILSRFVIAFLPRIKCLLISWLQSLSAVILEPKKIKSVTASTFSSSICHEGQLLRFFLSASSRGSLVPLHFLPLRWYYLHV